MDLFFNAKAYFYVPIGMYIYLKLNERSLTRNYRSLSASFKFSDCEGFDENAHSGKRFPLFEFFTLSYVANGFIFCLLSGFRLIA